MREILKWLYTKGADFSVVATTYEINKDLKEQVNIALFKIREELKNKIPERQYLVDNLPKDHNETYLNEAVKVKDRVDGFNSCREVVLKLIDELT